MSAPISETNGFRALKALQKISEDSRVEEIEGYGLDDGRVFIHLKRGYMFDEDGSRTKSVGSVADIKYVMSLIIETGK